MEVERVGDMTMQELRHMIDASIERRIRSDRPRPYQLKGDRPIEEVLESIRKNRIKPKPGTPSVVEMIREDRDR